MLVHCYASRHDCVVRIQCFDQAIAPCSRCLLSEPIHGARGCCWLVEPCGSCRSDPGTKPRRSRRDLTQHAMKPSAARNRSRLQAQTLSDRAGLGCKIACIVRHALGFAVSVVAPHQSHSPSNSPVLPQAVAAATTPSPCSCWTGCRTTQCALRGTTRRTGWTPLTSVR